MIFDRTTADVIEALKIRDEKIKNFIPVTDLENEVLEKGFFTVNTLNRIETKQRELAEALAELGYHASIVTKNWEKQDVFYLEDLQRIIDNCKKIKDSFYVYSTTPTVPEVKYHYQTANAIEKILFDIENVMSSLSIRYCGTFNCGE